jgi:hypothetical protein
MPPASATRTDLNNTALPNNHGDHWCFTVRAGKWTLQIGVTVWAKNINDSIQGNLVLGLDSRTTIEGGQPKPAMLSPKRYSNSY